MFTLLLNHIVIKFIARLCYLDLGDSRSSLPKRVFRHLSRNSRAPFCNRSGVTLIRHLTLHRLW